MKYFCNIFFLLIFAGLVSCGPMTKEDAMEQIRNKSVYSSFFYAPLHIGRQVVTLDPGVTLSDFIKERYGTLQDAGLVEIEILKESSWRNVFCVKLTEKGMKLSDARRSDEEHVFVPVCRIQPVVIDTLIPLDGGDMECRYVIEQNEITPFGVFLGFEKGKRFPIIDTLSK